MSDAAIQQFYADIFADLSVDREEAAELNDFLRKLNPPPDKLTKLRASAFKVGCQFLSDDNDTNVSLLRTINFVVHAIEMNCMVPKEGLEGADYDEDALTEFYKGIYDGLAVDDEENQELYEYFRDSHPPSAGALVQTRALAFKVGCDFLTDDAETNIKLLRCINVVVHALEMCCYQPKEYELQQDSSIDPASLNLSQAVQQLWDLDVNRLTPNDDYDINVQGGKKPFWKDDAARDPLFASVDRSVWKRGTYAAFLALLDNYERETGRAETITNSERAEVKTFLNAIMQTAPMQFCHKYCRAKNPSEVPADRAGFMKLLQTIWFDMYRREGVLDSSGFEHVFIGEVKNGDVCTFFFAAMLESHERCLTVSNMLSSPVSPLQPAFTIGSNSTSKKRRAISTTADTSSPAGAAKPVKTTTTICSHSSSPGRGLKSLLAHVSLVSVRNSKWHCTPCAFSWGNRKTTSNWTLERMSLSSSSSATPWRVERLERRSRKSRGIMKIRSSTINYNDARDDIQYRVSFFKLLLAILLRPGVHLAVFTSDPCLP